MGSPSLALSRLQPDPRKQPEATYVSLGPTLGLTNLVKGQEGRPGGYGDFPPGMGSTGWCGRPGSLASCRRPHTRAHTHPLPARGRAHSQALTRTATKPRVVGQYKPIAPMGGGAVATRAEGHPAARAFTC